MRRAHLPTALSSLGIAVLVAAIIIAQSAFTFSAVLESQHLTRTTSSRDAVARQIQTLESLLNRQRLAERSYAVQASPIFAAERAFAYLQFRDRVARLITIVPPDRAAQLRDLDARAAAYDRLAASEMALIKSGDVSA